jgi:hypothetical protein
MEQDNEIINHIRAQVEGVDEGLISPSNAIRSIAAMTEARCEQVGKKELRVRSFEDGRFQYTITSTVPGGQAIQYGSSAPGEPIKI